MTPLARIAAATSQPVTKGVGRVAAPMPVPTKAIGRVATTPVVAASHPAASQAAQIIAQQRMPTGTGVVSYDPKAGGAPSAVIAPPVTYQAAPDQVGAYQVPADPAATRQRRRRDDSSSQQQSGSGGGSAPTGTSPAAPEPQYDDAAMWTPPTQATPAATTSTALVAPVTTSTALATVPAATASPSLWTRFWNWIQFWKKADPAPAAAATTAHGETIESIAGSLVRRARAGDQNAMGMIEEVGRAAREGSPKAVVASGLIQRYIDQNPPSDMHGDDDCDPDSLEERVHQASMRFAQHVLSAPRLHQFASSEFGAETSLSHQAFQFGRRHPEVPMPELHPAHQRAHRVGRAVGLAERMQGRR